MLGGGKTLEKSWRSVFALFGFNINLPPITETSEHHQKMNPTFRSIIKPLLSTDKQSGAKDNKRHSKYVAFHGYCT